MARRDLRLALAGRTVSMVGDQALWLAMGIWAKQLTGSNAAAGMVFFFYGVPTLFAPLSGMLVDRVRRRPLLVTTEALLGGFVLLLLLVHGRDQLWLIYLVTFGYGAAGTITASARSALFRVMIEDPDELARLNGFLQTVQEGLRLLAPLLGAGLFAWLGGSAVAVLDSATFALVVAAFLAVRVREPAPELAASHWRDEVLAGARQVWRTVDLRRMTIALSVALLVLGFCQTVVFAVVDQGLHRAPSFVGVLEAAIGLGAVGGGVAAARAIRRWGEVRVMSAGLMAIGVGAVPLVVPHAPAVLAGLVVVGAGLPPTLVALFTCLQRRTPLGLQGRTFSAVDMMISPTQTVSIAVGAALSAVIDYRILVAMMALVVFASGLGLLSRVLSARPESDSTSGMPDAVRTHIPA